jgi:hypothetical protein
VSSRGLGSLKEDTKRGCQVVQDDYRLVVGADIVTDPSAPDAFVKGIMENVEWFYDAANDSWKMEQVNDLARNMRRLSSRQLKEEKLQNWSRYLDILGGRA